MLENKHVSFVNVLSLILNEIPLKFKKFYKRKYMIHIIV